MQKGLKISENSVIEIKLIFQYEYHSEPLEHLFYLVIA